MVGDEKYMASHPQNSPSSFLDPEPYIYATPAAMSSGFPPLCHRSIGFIFLHRTKEHAPSHVLSQPHSAPVDLLRDEKGLWANSGCAALRLLRQPNPGPCGQGTHELPLVSHIHQARASAQGLRAWGGKGYP